MAALAVSMPLDEDPGMKTRPMRARSPMASGWSGDKCRNRQELPRSQRPLFTKGKQILISGAEFWPRGRTAPYPS
eukprot:scaffold221432_cov41-Tisochrysis_lutea.AAC.4